MRNRLSLIVMTLLLALFLLGNVLIRVHGASFTYFADFNKYADSTSVNDFTEQGLTFTSNGIGIARAWGGEVQVFEGGESVTIVPASLASEVQFTYYLAGACDESALIELYHNGVAVDSTPIGYCDPAGTYARTV